MVWCGVVWCGVVWYGMMCFDTWYGCLVWDNFPEDAAFPLCMSTMSVLFASYRGVDLHPFFAHHQKSELPDPGEGGGSSCAPPPR